MLYICARRNWCIKVAAGALDNCTSSRPKSYIQHTAHESRAIHKRCDGLTMCSHSTAAYIYIGAIVITLQAMIFAINNVWQWVYSLAPGFATHPFLLLTIFTCSIYAAEILTFSSAYTRAIILKNACIYALVQIVYSNTCCARVNIQRLLIIYIMNRQSDQESVDNYIPFSF